MLKITLRTHVKLFVNQPYQIKLLWFEPYVGVQRDLGFGNSGWSLYGGGWGGKRDNKKHLLEESYSHYSI